MPEPDAKRVEHDPVLTPMTHLSFVIHNHAPATNCQSPILITTGDISCGTRTLLIGLSAHFLDFDRNMCPSPAIDTDGAASSSENDDCWLKIGEIDTHGLSGTDVGDSLG